MGVWARGLVLALGMLAGCADVQIPSDLEKPYVSIGLGNAGFAGSYFWTVNSDDVILQITNTFRRVDDRRSTRRLSGAYQRTIDLLSEKNFETLNSFCVSELSRDFDNRQVFFPPDTPDYVVEWHRQDRTVVYRRFDCGGGMAITAEYVDAFESIVDEVLGVNN